MHRKYPSTYRTGVGAKMHIVNPGVDHSATSNFYASRVLIEGTNGETLEAGWYEATWEGAGDTQFIYLQDSHDCTSPDECFWEDWSDECRRSNDYAFVTMNSVASSGTWSAWCYDGSTWQTMASSVSLGSLNAKDMEAFGEVRRTVSGATTLPGSGARFTSVQARNSSGTWAAFTNSIGGLYFFNSDDPYEVSYYGHYFDYYVDDVDN